MHTKSNKKGAMSPLFTYTLILVITVNFISLFFLNRSANESDNSPKLDRALQQDGFLSADSAEFLSSTFSGSSTEPDEDPYRFTNPDLAYKVLSALDVFEPVPNKYMGHGENPRNAYNVPVLGLKNDPDYCNKNRAYFVENPQTIFEKKNIVVEVGPQNLLRQVVRGLDGDVMPHIGRHMKSSEREKSIYVLDPSVNGFFTVYGIHKNKHVGQDFACLAQEFNHIPGHYSLNRKDTIAEGAIAYGEKFQDRPQCFSYEKYFPETWLLYDRDSCLDFFEILDTEEHKDLLEERKIVYIQKKAVGAHRGTGVTPLNNEFEQKLIAEYRNGALCGIKRDLNIVQKYVHNPLLLENRKFDFRMYMVIGSTNPMMVFYHDGFLRVSLYDYDANSTDKRVTMTNLALNDAIYEDAKKGKLHHGMDEEDLKIAQQWSFERLAQYLLDTGVISDPNWLDNYLRPEFKRAMIHLVRMSYHTFLPRSSLYEFYGVDFMLDSDLTLWFIEANSGPALGGYSAPMEKFIRKMLVDHFEVVSGLLKSRMKRVIELVNRIIREGEAVEDDYGDVMIDNLEDWREEFNQAIKNRYEPEFELSPDNGFSKIMDYNYDGEERYMGLLDGECIDF